jgi:hypothetical protein
MAQAVTLANRDHTFQYYEHARCRRTRCEKVGTAPVPLHAAEAADACNVGFTQQRKHLIAPARICDRDIVSHYLSSSLILF